MKTLIAFICIIALSFVAGQASAQNITFGPAETYRSVTKILPTDTVNTSTEVGKVYLVDCPSPYTYILNAKATRTSTNKACAFYLYGSINGVNYYAIGSPIAWKQTTADTAVIFNSGTTAVNWRFLKATLKANASGARATLGAQYLKIGR